MKSCHRFYSSCLILTEAVALEITELFKHKQTTDKKFKVDVCTLETTLCSPAAPYKLQNSGNCLSCCEETTAVVLESATTCKMVCM